jgi:hypothetical protein
MKIKRLLFTGLLLFACYQSIDKELGPYNDILFSEFHYFEFSILILVTLLSMFFDLRNFRKNKALLHLLPSCAGMICILITSWLIYQRIQTDNLKTLVKFISIDRQNSSFELSLKANSKLTLTEQIHNGLTTYYGEYVRAGDSLVITKFSKNDYLNITPDKAIIKNDTCYWANKFATMIIDRNP